MELETFFTAVQSIIADTPLFLIGSGCSAALGLPGMAELGDHLISSLDSKYRGVPCWDQFHHNLVSGDDLETALTGITLTDDISNDIQCETWCLLSPRDLAVFDRVLFDHQVLPLGAMLKKFYQAHPKRINVITTNYDRIIEYSCDSAKLPVTTGFDGCYLKQYSNSFKNKDSVNLIKIHGSLDTFRDPYGVTVTVPMLHELCPGLIPEIIMPGLHKYEAVLRGTHRPLLIEAEHMINDARSFLCIGYGFNDTQIQEGILTKARAGTPLIVLTKKVSESAARLLANNAVNYVSIQEGEVSGTTEVCINRDMHVFDGTFWSIDGFMSIID